MKKLPVCVLPQLAACAQQRAQGGSVGLGVVWIGDVGLARRDEPLVVVRQQNSHRPHEALDVSLDPLRYG